MAGTIEVSSVLYAFYNHFLPSFQRDMVPAKQKFPYLTYNMTIPVTSTSDQNSVISNDVLQTVLLFDKRENYTRLYEHADQIGKAIPPTGVSLPFGDGKQYLMLFRGAPFAQNYVLPKEEQEQKIKAVLLNIELRAYYI
ncbi:hypothetical protein LJC49_07145 [Ruminococcaceae bacterium OttesenSCG-928-I18]|nr:hypothetical protein [Ruminococcaceae bacterium OttesenSCG-928-I18]